ncbi:MAG: sigma-E factor negative regulatory protein [Pseudomonadota bacterium]
MKIEQTPEISALFDGELEAHEVRAAIKAGLNDADRWRIYGLIGDGLRGEPVDVPDMTASVMARIGEEPVVLAPRNLRSQRRHHPLLALAASVAGVAVVGWVALTGNPQSPATEHTLAGVQRGKMEISSAVPPAPTFAQAPQVILQGDMSEYLLAHHAQASAGRLGDSTKQIRTVAMRPDRP